MQDEDVYVALALAGATGSTDLKPLQAQVTLCFLMTPSMGFPLKGRLSDGFELGSDNPAGPMRNLQQERRAGMDVICHPTTSGSSHVSKGFFCGYRYHAESETQ
jgi:hypothetical protein